MLERRGGVAEGEVSSAVDTFSSKGRAARHETAAISERKQLLRKATKTAVLRKTRLCQGSKVGRGVVERGMRAEASSWAALRFDNGCWPLVSIAH